MKKMFFALIGCFVAICAHAAQIVNVDYIHKLIQQEWDVTVPIRTDNVMAAANMKYLLTAIDVANQILNGEKTTDYGNGEFATTQAVDTIATNQAVETLVRKIDNITPAPEDAEYKFFLTTMPDTDSFSFRIIAAGEFYIDWGDGKTQLITKNDVEYTDYSYKYKKTGTYTIKLGGIATGYIIEDAYVESAISFSSSASKIASIDGSLGAIFGTLVDGTVPKFSGMFSGAVNLSSIPANLFSGVNGTQEEMFSGTFEGCSGLTSIPDGLFAGISGAPTNYMFSYTFYGCESLTYIPANLFAGVSGSIHEGMFNGTFAGCTSLRTIPEGLFASLDGGDDMYLGGLAFMETFAGSGIESIPENLFGNIAPSLSYGVFMQTFAYCPNLTGPSARINGVYLYNIWPDATEEQVYGMYEGSTGLDDYACIPYAWGGGGEECDSSSSTPSVPEDAVYDFYLTTTSDTSSFEFSISAAGEFYIDWGDGKTEWVTKSDTTNMTFGHKYASRGGYNIRLGGQATAYNTDPNTAAISFYVGSDTSASETNVRKIASIDGSLGAIFGTLPDATEKQPRFYRTFDNAYRMKGAIPENLFAGISGAPAESMFIYTFYGCVGLTGAIPDGLFAGISGAPASYMFHGTFYNCSGLTSIPSDLFAGISGAPAAGMFSGTFEGCSGLISIPENLFAGISGAPASNMFADTFEGCSGLTGAIPDGLFAGISGAPASFMFSDTFYGCKGLTGAIPDGLFGNITGTPAEWMFASTFEGCSGLTSIPENLFGNISGPARFRMFYNTFYYCTSLTGPSARINGQYLYEIWPYATLTQVGGMYTGATGLEDYRCIPTVWGGGGEICASAPEFTLTTTSDTGSFKFSISAAGKFVVDWGDGTVETITKPDTTDTKYSHNYSTAGAYTIGLSGQATAYNTSITTAAISFKDTASKIASIEGSLGAIFGTLSSDTNNQPRFSHTFSGAYNMTGSIPENLFAGISGAPATYMFYGTFYGCSGLTGPSARINGQYLYEIWPVNSNYSFCNTYTGATKLDDYSNMPYYIKFGCGGSD